MENLSLVGCKSLTENEKQETNGGIAPIIYVGGLLVVGAGAGLYDAWTESKSKKKK
ncbi:MULTISPECIES: class IIb bacteriocin, lactobin A/cerein 7B family [Bacillus cereus group]|uniref:class IIb bacteriocin, lactobin A/cerein 7B family n=1 Tax=Bacillus cereus group TaxID=86661 RepID=UPI0009BB0692|nr:MULTISPECIES: class IIb bacteriocin, lactobin A/cerein 7B family [Bacillus cereus group]MBZ3765663.1 class IIb bacteriocin, lactobin A/cerein 7B family [Bacillus cereus]MBZ8125968.1 class IIb bacteriocin, lactobin A/cerein 7B family [Bacillus thuringiensis]MCR6790323.1 class IIb bacteriocin, lactobin A/cerein 7B family [Bacillus thuringiensis]MCR6826190.1 class IIb bacteriocin, lactobin A/cerein 7B family [Bacillus thuringiensis]MCR6832176.1 class IIb bacteriocin, lactobin A/cerein 7B famil